MLLCLELHCLGAEALQQARMLGEWRWIRDTSRVSPKPEDWSYLDCPYPRGAVVRCGGRYYEAVATLNTCCPKCPTSFIRSIAFILGDSRRAKAIMLPAILTLNAV